MGMTLSSTTNRVPSRRFCSCSVRGTDFAAGPSGWKNRLVGRRHQVAAFGKVGTHVPFSSLVFQPTWSEWIWVLMTTSTSL